MRKNTVLVVIICLFCNGLTPRSSALSGQYVDLLCLIQNQPLLKYYFSLSTIPIAIVNRLFIGEECPGAASGNKHPKQDRDRGNTSAEYSLVTPVKTTGKNSIIRTQSPHSSGSSDFKTCYYDIAGGEYRQRLQSNVKCDSGINGFHVLLLMLFILLPRGALGDHTVRRISDFIRNPIWNTTNSGFFFGGNK